MTYPIPDDMSNQNTGRRFSKMYEDELADPTMSPEEKVLLATIRLHSDWNTGVCRLMNDELSRASGMTSPRIQRALARLAGREDSPIRIDRKGRFDRESIVDMSAPASSLAMREDADIKNLPHHRRGGASSPATRQPHHRRGGASSPAMREDVDTSAGTPIADNGLHRPAATPSDSSSDASPERYSDDEDPSSSHPSHGEKIESDPAFAEAVKVAANFKANPHAAVGALLHDVPGSTPALIVAACEAARSKGKGWGWIRRRVENQVKEGADITPSKPAEEEGVWLPGETSRIDGDSLVRRVERIAEKHGITPREYILRCAVHLGPDRIAELRRTWPADRIANVVADPECYHPDDRRAEPSEAEKAAAVARMGKLLETVHGKTLGPGIFAEADVEAERRRQMAALDEWRRKRAATPPEPSPPIAPSISIAPPTAILAAQGAAS